MHGAGHEDDLAGLQMPGNKAASVPFERLPQRQSTGDMVKIL